MIRPTLQPAPIAVNAFFRGFRVKIVTYTIPAFLVCYFAYGDASGLTDAEVSAADDFMRDNNLSHLVSAGEEYFSYTSDVPWMLAGDMVDAIFIRE